MQRRSFLKRASSLALLPVCLKPSEFLFAQNSSTVPPAGGATLPAEEFPNYNTPSDHPLTIVTPVDHGEALLNPGMGWNYPYYTDNRDSGYGGDRPINDTLDWFPGANAAYFRVGWAHIEPEEGKFNWDYTDRVAQHWIDKGKQVAYCWIVFSPSGEPAAPAWLKKAGAEGWEFPKTDLKPGPQWVPNWGDPVFLEKFNNFLAAASARYNGKPYVQFIEIGSLGTWGEGHTYTRSKVRLPEITEDIQRKHLALWKKHFPNTALLVNDGYDNTTWQKGSAVEYAANMGYGLADWSIMANATKPFLSADLARPIWPNQPIGLENGHYGIKYRQGNWEDGTAYIDAMERYHTSFLRIHWWPDEFLNGNGIDLPGNFDLVRRMNQRIGYRFQVVKAAWASRIKSGKNLSCSITWRNAGVAPCYAGGFPSISLFDSNGKLVATGTDKGFDVRNLAPGPTVAQAPVTSHTISIEIPGSLPAGNYNLCVSVESKDGSSRYRLPITEFADANRYRLGTVAITS